MAPRFASRPLLAASLSVAAVAAAQDVPAPQVPVPAVTPAPTPTPSPTATAVVVPAVSPVPGEVPPAAVPTSRPTTSASRPRSSAAVTPTPTPTPTPMPTPTPSPTRAPRPPIETVILPPPTAAAPLWPWLAGGGALLTVLLGWVAFRRQREAWVDEDYVPEAIVEPVPPPPPAVARLIVALRPVRAGLNLISVTAECEVTVTNSGGAPADDIRAALHLTSVHDGQEAELAAFHAAPILRPAAPAFTLAPGEERRINVITALPHDAIHALEAGGRPLFVALLALAVRYHDGRTPRRMGQAFALGGERDEAAKLSPFWLDGGARSYRNVAVRPYGAPVEG